MTRVADEASDFLKSLIFNKTTPQNIRDGLITRLRAISARETTLKNAITTARDPLQQLSVRLQAIQIVINFAKGDQ